MQKILLLCLAGGLGSLCRYGLSGLVQRFSSGSFPLGTFVVNCLGCLLFGIAWGFLEERVGPQFRVVVLTGFMGAFTTFSTYAFESVALLQHQQWMFALLNIFGQLLIGFILLFAGLALGRLA